MVQELLRLRCTEHDVKDSTYLIDSTQWWEATLYRANEITDNICYEVRTHATHVGVVTHLYSNTLQYSIFATVT